MSATKTPGGHAAIVTVAPARGAAPHMFAIEATARPDPPRDDYDRKPLVARAVKAVRKSDLTRTPGTVAAVKEAAMRMALERLDEELAADAAHREIAGDAAE